MQKRLSARSWALALVALFALAPTFAQTPSNPDGDSLQALSELRYVAPRGACRIAGTWVGSSPPFAPAIGDQTLIFTEIITPLDTTCRRFSSVVTPINPEVTFSGLFPEATGASSLYGTLTRAGRNRYNYEGITYFTGPPAGGLPIRGPVVYFWSYSGTMTCADDECLDKVQEGVLSLWSNTDDPARDFPPLGIMGVSDQDADDDGFADQGETPIFTAPFPLPSRRLSP